MTTMRRAVPRHIWRTERTEEAMFRPLLDAQKYLRARKRGQRDPFIRIPFS
jgi:hypothetical protein